MKNALGRDLKPTRRASKCKKTPKKTHGPEGLKTHAQAIKMLENTKLIKKIQTIF